MSIFQYLSLIFSIIFNVHISLFQNWNNEMCTLKMIEKIRLRYWKIDICYFIFSLPIPFAFPQLRNSFNISPLLNASEAKWSQEHIKFTLFTNCSMSLYSRIVKLGPLNNVNTKVKEVQCQKITISSSWSFLS